MKKKLYKLVCFLKFNKKIEKEILHLKSLVKKKFGNQIYLDHPVHLTLFTFKTKYLNEINNLYKNFNSSKKKIQNLNITINKSNVFYNDPLTNGHTIYYEIKKNLNLNLLQEKHLKLLSKYILFDKKDLKKFRVAWMKRNFIKYGFPFVGKKWIPHITVSSLSKVEKDHQFIKFFLKKKISFKDKIKEIKFYEIKKNKHKFLFRSKL